MQVSASSRSLRHVVRPFVGCALVAACALPASAQSAQSAQPGQNAQSVRPVVGQAASRKPFAEWSESVHSLRDSIVAIARGQIGTRYVLGGTTPNVALDCSGLVRYVMAAMKVDLPRTAAQQARVGDEVTRDPSRLRPGDLLTFGRRDRRGVSHIGIYVGNGRYVHASSVAGRVIESDLSRSGSPLIKAWRGVRRVIAGTESDSTTATRRGDG